MKYILSDTKAYIFLLPLLLLILLPKAALFLHFTFETELDSVAYLNEGEREEERKGGRVGGA